MLFNTLTYAQFFAIVFAVTWLLVRRRLALWLPWIATLSYGLFGTGQSLSTRSQLVPFGIVAIAFVLTAGLYRQGRRRAADDAPPPGKLALASCLINFAALAWLVRDASQQHLISAALNGIGVEIERTLEPRSGIVSALCDVAAALVFAGAGFFFVRAKRVRLLFILGASYVFYAYFDWRFLFLIFGSSTIDFVLGWKIGHTENPITRKRWLYATVALNLGVLGVFKYFNFGVDTALTLLNELGFQPSPVALKIALPIGISFFTFESMSYVIDVYRRVLPPHRSYLEYLSFVAFFPHLVAGPIVRPRDLLPQLGGEPRFNALEGSEGLFLIAWGLIKKVAIGDYLALNLVDRVFDQPIQYSALECYTAVVGYAVQIYCDFSGYSDVAIGSALLLGVRFPLNFDAPYKAHNIQDFWRRWHISLSTWLRDYLYIPLGGSRKGTLRTYVNLMLTMLLGGLWHGASWNFVIWGGLHGGALALHRAVSGKSTTPPSPRLRIVGVFATFHFVCAAWIFFRCDTFNQARAMFSQLAQLTTFHPNLHGEVLFVLAIGLITHFLPERLFEDTKNAFMRAPTVAQAFALVLAAVVVKKMSSASAVPFVYYQF